MNWINIEESVERPSVGEEVIAYSKKDGIEYKAYYDVLNGESTWQRNGRCNMEGVTHYMSKLQPPCFKFKECVKDIMNDLSDRKGFDFNNLDSDILEEIRNEIEDTLRKYFD